MGGLAASFFMSGQRKVPIHVSACLAVLANGQRRGRFSQSIFPRLIRGSKADLRYYIA
jgi:hypothetical protein